MDNPKGIALEKIPNVITIPKEEWDKVETIRTAIQSRPIFIEDAVTSPSYYQQGGIETWDVIEAWGLDYFLGNVVKYISRAGKKDPEKYLEDLCKAKEYLDRKIEMEQRRKGEGA